MEETLYYHGDILTMDEPIYAGALLVRGGRIAAVGDKDVVFGAAGRDARRVDLDGRTLMPSFLDAHSHITAYARTLGLAQLGGARSFAELTRRLRQFREDHACKPGELIIGFGYDHNSLQERRHPNKSLLDAALPDNPVLLTHQSGHMGVANSAALQLAGIGADTPDPEGGVIGRENGTAQPNGYLEEQAFFSLARIAPAPTREQQLRQIKLAQAEYFRHGVTTIQDGLTDGPAWQMLEIAARQGDLLADVVAYLDIRSSREIAYKNAVYRKVYYNRLKIGGYKMILDGSPQGRTAWMTQPYENAPDGYRGYPSFQDEEVRRFVETASADGMQLLAHCNGDAAADQFLRACQAAAKTHPALPACRPVMIHAQTVRDDQLDAMRALGMIPSFFTAHTYYWGDTHLENLGARRAARISPARSAQERGLPFTFHQDTPVLPPDMLETVWCAVNRLSKSGKSMGEGERISPLAALRAVTQHAAYQYFEEKEKGTLAKGKRADLVILDRNPLNVDPMEIRSIRVCETIKDGQSVFKYEEAL